MNRYQLAKIVQWADCLQSRKRLQKVVFMLIAKGCPLEADFLLHHYGPYSPDVARLSDQMVQAALLVEKVGQNQVGVQYSYRLSDETIRQIEEVEKTPQGQELKARLSPFESIAKKLLNEDLRQLEYASTIVYFRAQGSDWPESIEKACLFKKTRAVEGASHLARLVIA